MSDAEDRLSRIRTLTKKGREFFYSRLESYVRDVDKSWKEFEDILVNFDESSTDIKYLRKIETDLEKAKKHYVMDTDVLFSFFNRCHTEESEVEMEKHLVKNERCHTVMDNFREKIKNLLLDAAEILSERYETRSEATISSRHSSIKSELRKKRMQAKAQQTRLAFAEKQTELQKEKNLLEAKLDLLEQQKEVATLEAEIRVLEDNDSSRGLEYFPSRYTELMVSSKEKFTADFVNGQTRFSDIESKEEKKIDIHDNILSPPRREPLNPYASEFRPCSHSGVATDLTQFLLKKDLLLSRFSSFNDRPETYETWKATFKNITKELNVTPFEEMDLLVKWLGPESRKFASSMRASNINNPFTGLRRIWDRLEERYGRPEMIETALKQKLDSFPKISSKEPKKLYDLLDILTEIESVKENPTYAILLSYFDSSSGVIPIINKLPHGLQEKWVSQAARYKKQFNVPFPPFGFLVNFIRELSTTKNDPALQYECSESSSTSKKRQQESKGTTGSLSVHSRKTELAGEDEENKTNTNSRCPIHKADHTLHACRAFRAKPLQERKDILREHGFCYKCCMSKHLSRNCKATIKCDICGNKRHATAMHPDQGPSNVTASVSTVADGGERKLPTKSTVDSKCTELCEQTLCGRSCAKVVPVRVYPLGNKDSAVRMYAIIDEQSNRTLARSEFFNLFDTHNETQTYTLFSCSGRSICSGRRACGFVIESIDGSYQINLPTVIECDDIPNNRQEIPTPEVANAYPHLSEIASELHPLDIDMEILLLIGRDLGDAHHIIEQRIGPSQSPYAQKLGLGWVVIGEVCLGRTHRPEIVIANKVTILPNGRTTVCDPCTSNIAVKEIPCIPETDLIGDSVFHTTEYDDQPGLSIDDRLFLSMMDRELYRNDSGQWVAPLPFKEPRRRLPDNRQLAVKRAHILDVNLKRNPEKCLHATTFMQQIIDSGHAERAPPVNEREEFWYLPIFSVYHSKKPNQIRMVFDSFAQFNGVSLNNVLLSGPDLTNSLLGVLMRFRVEKIGIMADIQQMFHCFKVKEDHRNYLRFLWYEDNNPQKELVDYRMCVHVFGNSPSPAVATYGLRRTAQNAETTFGHDVRSFVEHNFYVDDGLVSLPSVKQAVSLMKRTQQALIQEGGLRLHKIVSNNSDVMNSFPSEDLAKDLMSLDLTTDVLPIQRSLGMSWDLKSDSFTFRISAEEKPFTRRGLLSTLNSFYDPLGFLDPVLIKGKLLLRKLNAETTDWDQVLPKEYEKQWTDWKEQMQSLETLYIPRQYTTLPLTCSIRQEVHLFTDASEEAIAAVAYIKLTDADGNQQQGFLLGKAKVAPKSAVTIPRLELCAAVLGIEIANIIKKQMSIPTEEFHFHTDSKVALGYICNNTRRFYTYVSNRVEKIRKASVPEQWNYVPSEYNPADEATRSSSNRILTDTTWLKGPTRWFTKRLDPDDTEYSEPENLGPNYKLVNSELDKEIRPVISVIKSCVDLTTFVSGLKNYSTWKGLVGGIAHLKHIARSWSGQPPCKGWHACSKAKDIHLLQEAEKVITREVQKESFAEEIEQLQTGQPIKKGSTILKLNPFIDSDGILRVGGRLNKASLDVTAKNPIIISGKHHIAKLIIRHYHDLMKHQGRHYTEGAVRAAGFWIIGGKRQVSSIIFHCVTCRKLRRCVEHQIMADLPKDRLTPGPPFSSVGVDTFGPMQIVTRRTRGGQAHGKRWAIMFSCLTSRAVHMEVIEDMTSSSFINALRRFIAIRGHVKEFRSDRGTNFIGSTEHLGVDVINIEDGPIKRFFLDQRSVWIFNPPHASHMGGAWERMIGLTRRILDTMLMDKAVKALTHEILTTFLAEASAIINSRPLVLTSSDPEYPLILTPNTLLTLKTDKGGEPLGPFSEKDAYAAQWKRAQHLADIFWQRWRKEYLVTLQNRKRWPTNQRNITVGDVVLLKDDGVHRCD
ncbi:uncharacterized protein LOC130053620 [Ostrea edulis]|uniref:uncharacterized protein LOC130053620 n=1 Tax=Ostrea edulis TaxID=37623 RepID=UPI0024AE9D56|nr:uncharacterized protein LOC130053620 [Ostrea edulis]